ncbi:glucosyl-3-phosphoglycerate synthase [Thermobifida cellulosilytica]|uniref:Glucosyl-3-phosphoglycerate synthase n=1 Tax=Thermobifida cellulosilytica TB100 TaxID=665004 RepID=A0A147KJN0_THECS|nr:glucosyl-3-phosphoglycerate synthase [Thermobifida cellulosilytica]KUP97500.1 glucosyl-3-phosphoglycerate synthase [Thermobifida cellulosilytica TB100]
MMPTRTRQWLANRMSSHLDWPASRALALKGDTTISVVLPARDEQETVGSIVSAIREALVERVPLVDELVVIDSRSADDTAKVAARAGATVHHQDDILSHLPGLWGKGEALWKSLAVTSGDVVVFVDSDIRNFGPHFVTGLVGPLLADPELVYVKGCYSRPLREADSFSPFDGGRVTELLARPLLNMCWPELSGFVQPLAGEYAGRRTALEAVPFVCGYGVEFALLVDLAELVGVDRMAQVDLGCREHSHQSTAALGRMAGQILDTAWSRMHRQGIVVPERPFSRGITQFVQTADGYESLDWDVEVSERPPMREVLAGSGAPRPRLPRS